MTCMAVRCQIDRLLPGAGRRDEARNLQPAQPPVWSRALARF